MKNFSLDRSMLTLGGQFYPTGHIVALFPDLSHAEAAARALGQAGVAADEIQHITPDAMLRDVVRTVGNEGMPLPSAGTEADTVRRFADYASQGHHGLLIPTPDGHDEEAVMRALRENGVSHAQKYRMLVIEDLA